MGIQQLQQQQALKVWKSEVSKGHSQHSNKCQLLMLERTNPAALDLLYKMVGKRREFTVAEMNT